VLRPDDVPKYLNSPKTDIFDKGRLLYGLDLARQEIRKNDQVVIVEGYLDVIGPYQAGFKNCVSPMGTALTEDQFRLIKRYSRRIILALDPDAAGQRATLRGLETARQTLEREGEVVFDARGLMQVEGRLQADIRVTTLPEGLDPDEIALADPDRWADLIAQAKPVVIHVMETLVAREDIDDPKTKEAVANQVLPLIEDVKGSVEREAYRQRLARLLKVDERALVRRSPGDASRRHRPYHQQPEVPSLTTSTSRIGHRHLEEACIKALLFDPTLIYFVDKAFREYELACLNPDDLANTDFKEIFRLVKQSLDQDELEPLAYLQENMPEALADLYHDSPQEENYPDWRIEPNAPILESLLEMFVRLRRIRIDEALDQIVFLQTQATEHDEETPSDYSKLIMEYVQVRSKLDKVLKQPFSHQKPNF
jgi:DNA primase